METERRRIWPRLLIPAAATREIPGAQPRRCRPLRPTRRSDEQFAARTRLGEEDRHCGDITPATSRQCLVATPPIDPVATKSPPCRSLTSKA